MLRIIGRNFGAQLLSLIISFADRFVVVGLLIRVWGAGLYADWGLLLAAAGLLQLGEFGLNIYYGNVWQRAKAENDAAGFSRMLSVSLFLSVCLAVLLIGAIAIVLLTVDLKPALSLSGVAPEHVPLIFALLGLSITGSVTRGAISQIYRGNREFARGTTISQLPAVGTIIGAVTVGVAGGEPVHLAVVYLVSQLALGWGFMLLDLRMRYPELRFRMMAPTGAELRHLFGRIGWLAVQQDAPVAWLQLPVLILGGLSITGQPLVAFLILRTIVSFFRQLATMLSIAVGVELADAFHGGARDAVLKTLDPLGIFLSALAGALAAAIFVFGRGVVAIWTGSPDLFDPAIAGWLVLGSLFAAPATPLAQTLTFTNQPRPAAIASLIQLAIGVAAVALLAPRFGAAGAAAGLSAGEAIGMGVVLPLLASRSIGLVAMPFMVRCAAAAALAGGWCLLAGLLITRVFDPAGVGALVLGAALWGFIGFLPAMAFAVPGRQRRRAIAAMAGMARRFLRPG